MGYGVQRQTEKATTQLPEKRRIGGQTIKIKADQSHFTKRFKYIYGVTLGHVFPNRKNILD